MIKIRNLLHSSLKPVWEKSFVYKEYELFLDKIKNNPLFRVIPLKDFAKVKSDTQVIVGLRHDVDRDIRSALNLARIEYEAGFRSTFFILHTARYYKKIIRGMISHNNKLLELLITIQNNYNHEIGWHNDLVTLQIVFETNPVSYLRKELKWLRNNGINIEGVAAHGSKYCYLYKYHNNYFFKDFPNIVQHLPNNREINIKSKNIILTKALLSDFNLTYEAYHLDYNKYFSDSNFDNYSGKRWHPSEINWEEFKAGDRIIFLFHPEHWSKSVWVKYYKQFYFLPENLEYRNIGAV